MTIGQYKKWIWKNILKLKKDSFNEFFERAIELKDIKIKSDLIKHEIESSFNSVNRFELIKITHIFGRFDNKENEVGWGSDFIKIEKLLDFLKDINKKLRLKFNIHILKKILNLPLLPMIRETNLVINFDFKEGELIKISVGFNPESCKQLFKILSKNLSNLSKVKNDKLGFFNIDFYPDRMSQLKIYYSYEPFTFNQILKKINDLRTLTIFNTLLKRTSPDYIFIMKKFKQSNRLFSGGIYFNYNRPKKLKEFLMIEYLQKKYPFLQSLRFLIKDFNISFLAIKPAMLEIYFK